MKSTKKNKIPINHQPSPINQQSIVWTFTNQTQLNKKQFLNYVERKVFRTIRKHNLLPKNKIFILKKWLSSKEGAPGGANTLNAKVLKQILETKFTVKMTHDSRLTTHDSSNLSQIAEDIFKKILKGNFKPTTNSQQLIDTKTPLLYLSDKEVELYAKLKNIKGIKRKQNKKIQTLFKKFLTKNQDLELNIIKAAEQIQ